MPPEYQWFLSPRAKGKIWDSDGVSPRPLDSLHMTPYGSTRQGLCNSPMPAPGGHQTPHSLTRPLSKILIYNHLVHSGLFIRENVFTSLDQEM